VLSSQFKKCRGSTAPAVQNLTLDREHRRGESASTNGAAEKPDSRGADCVELLWNNKPNIWNLSSMSFAPKSRRALVAARRGRKPERSSNLKRIFQRGRGVKMRKGASSRGACGLWK
jgi:hypothetical protein